MAQETAPAEFVGAFRWTRPDAGFGGLSGIEVSADGFGFAAIGDRGITVEGRFLREGDRIAGVEAGPMDRLREASGRPVAGDRQDAEGLAVDEAGHWYVAFERDARVVIHDGRSSRGRPTRAIREFRWLPRDAGLEALARAPAGELYAIAEGALPGVSGHPVFRHDATGWRLWATIPADPPWSPVGADVGPDGLLYVLERQVFLPIGFASRVRRYPLGADAPGIPETVLETRAGAHGNLEGLAVWADGAGIRLTMVSDNNFRWLQRTEIVEYRIGPPLEPGRADR